MARDRKFSTEDLFEATNQLLLQHGYDGFTFSLLAEQLEVSRGAIYKYYENKEELITDYMLYEMTLFLVDLKGIYKIEGFQGQFDFLINLIFKNTSIHKLIEVGNSVPVNASKKAKQNREKLDSLLLEMYSNLQDFIKLGKEEGHLKGDLPDGLLLGMIFQTVAIPNHFGIPYPIWVSSIKEILSYGMFK